MTAKTCLRCDWLGDTSEPSCPDCGQRPLFVTGGPLAPGQAPPVGSVPDVSRSPGIPPGRSSADDEEPREPEAGHGRNRRIGALAVAASIGLVALVLVTRAGQSTRTPAEEPTTASPAAAKEVTRRFLQAFEAFDAGEAATYLTSDADITGLIGSVGTPGMRGTPDELPRLISLLEAQRYVQIVDVCDAESVADGIGVRCEVFFHLLGSNELDPPSALYGPSTFELTIRDGAIVRATQAWETERFSPEVWEPFADWLSTTYPRDAR
jgi:hypothetical protein